MRRRNSPRPVVAATRRAHVELAEEQRRTELGDMGSYRRDVVAVRNQLQKDHITQKKLQLNAQKWATGCRRAQLAKEIASLEHTRFLEVVKERDAEATARVQQRRAHVRANARSASELRDQQLRSAHARRAEEERQAEVLAKKEAMAACALARGIAALSPRKAPTSPRLTRSPRSPRPTVPRVDMQGILETNMQRFSVYVAPTDLKAELDVDAAAAAGPPHGYYWEKKASNTARSSASTASPSTSSADDSEYQSTANSLPVSPSLHPQPEDPQSA